MPAAFLFGGGSGFSQLLTKLVDNRLTPFPSFRPDFLPFSQFLIELVVHSPKWATGSWLPPGFPAFFPISGPASGPLDKVDHWLPAFSRFSGLFPGF